MVVAVLALPQAAGRNQGGARPLAFGATEAVGPAEVQEVMPAEVLIGETAEEPDQGEGPGVGRHRRSAPVRVFAFSLPERTFHIWGLAVSDE